MFPEIDCHYGNNIFMHIHNSYPSNPWSRLPWKPITVIINIMFFTGDLSHAAVAGSAGGCVWAGQVMCMGNKLQHYM